jgi:hypothetical protein
MKSKQKINDIDFTYEIIISKGIGKLTRKAEQMIVTLVENAIRVKQKDYFDEDVLKDSIQQSYLNLLCNWQSFNPDRTNSAFAYLSEIHKRSTAEFVNLWYNKKGIKKEEQSYIKSISINSSNNGQGLFNL